MGDLLLFFSIIPPKIREERTTMKYFGTVHLPSAAHVLWAASCLRHIQILINITENYLASLLKGSENRGAIFGLMYGVANSH